MSRLDSFQHHYLMSLILLCLVFFPRLNAADIFTRNPPDPLDRAGPRTCAWAYALLAVTVAVVYLYTGIAKLDAHWRAGHTLQRIEGSERLFQLAAPLLHVLRLDADTFWTVVAHGTIAVELLVAVSYLAAVRLADQAALLPRIGCGIVCLMAVMLHIGFEIMNLAIGWFSAYMILLACVCFLPSRWLMAVGGLVTWPARRVAPRIGRGFQGVPGTASVIGYVAASVAVAASLALAARFINLPGAQTACLAAGLALIVTVVVAARRGAASTANTAIIATTAAGGIMWAVIALSSVRYDYYLLAGMDHRRLDQTDAALAAFHEADRYAPAHGIHRAQLHLELGRIAQQHGKPDDAVNHYRRAVRAAPDHAELNYHVANAFRSIGRRDDAMACYRNALRHETGVAQLHHNLAAVLLESGRIAEALEHFEAALRIDPDFVPSLDMFAWTLATHPHDAVRDPARAVRLAERAVERTDARRALMLDTLAAAYASAGRFDHAVTTARAALALAEKHGDLDRADRIRHRLERYHQSRPYRELPP
jgi:Tfp pilus assembly protein PilF